MTIKYENENHAEEEELITKYSLVAGGENETSMATDMNNGYVQPNRVIKRYDLKDQPVAPTPEEMTRNDYDMTFDESSAVSTSNKVGGGAGFSRKLE